MQLYYLTPLIYPSNYANRLQVLKMCEAFSLHVHVTLFVSELREDKEAIFASHSIKDSFDIIVPEHGLGWPRSVRHAWSLRTHIARAPGDTVFYIRDIMLAMWLVILSKRFRKNFVFESHSLHRFPVRLYKFVLHCARGVIVTNKAKMNILREWGFHSEDIIVEPNAVDVMRFADIPDKQSARARLGLPQDKIIVLYVGSFTEDRGSDIFFETAKLSDDPSLYFMAVGGTEQQVKRARTIVSKGQCDVRGRVPYEDVPTYMSAADILTSPSSAKFAVSLVHGSPLKIPEYMYVGRAILVSDVPSMREWVDEENAYFAPPDDPGEWLVKIKDISSEPEQAHMRAHRAQEIVARHTWEQRARRILMFIGER